MADGQVTNGFVSALWNVDEEELWKMVIAVVVIVVNVLVVVERICISFKIIQKNACKFFIPPDLLTPFFIIRLSPQDR